MKMKVQHVCYIAMLAALNIILTRFFSIRIPFEGMEALRIGFGTLPLILAGVLMGGRKGFITGVLGDVIGFQLNPSGFYLPTFTLVAGLNGMLVPMVLHWLGWEERSFKKLAFAITLNQVLTSLLLTPFLLQFHFGIPMWATMPGRLISQLLLIPAMVVMVHLLLKRLQQSGMVVFQKSF